MNGGGEVEHFRESLSTLHCEAQLAYGVEYLEVLAVKQLCESRSVYLTSDDQHGNGHRVDWEEGRIVMMWNGVLPLSYG